MSEFETPFLTLGRHLKYVREQANQSLEEVSGAVEIDESSLERIESGLERPSEDVLLLLISYFDVKEREAVKLWELADYDAELPDRLKSESELPSQSTVLLLALDTRTLYSDKVSVEANSAGITLVFSQSTGDQQATPVARLGMSIEQGRNVIAEIDRALMIARYGTANKLLSPGASRGNEPSSKSK